MGTRILQRTPWLLAILVLAAALSACNAKPPPQEAVGTAAPDITAVQLRSVLDTATADLGRERTEASFTRARCGGGTFVNGPLDRYVVVAEYHFALREGDDVNAAAMYLRDRWTALGWNPALSSAPTDVAIPSAGLARIEGTDPASGLRVKGKTLPKTLAVTTISGCYLYPKGKTWRDYRGQLLGDQGPR